jgi:hypothetical protein
MLCNSYQTTSKVNHIPEIYILPYTTKMFSSTSFPIIFTQSVVTEFMKTDTALRKFTVILKDIPTFVLHISITEDTVTKGGWGKGRTIKITICVQNSTATKDFICCYVVQQTVIFHISCLCLQSSDLSV